MRSIFLTEWEAFKCRNSRSHLKSPSGVALARELRTFLSACIGEILSFRLVCCASSPLRSEAGLLKLLVLALALSDELLLRWLLI